MNQLLKTIYNDDYPGGYHLMRKVNLTMNQQLKYETIKELVDHNGNKQRAACRLGLSVRQSNRAMLYSVV